MEYYLLNNCLISKLGYGTLHLPVLDDGKVDINKTKEIIDLLIKNGVTYFDLGHGYCDYQAEYAIRKALVERYDRSQFYLSNKMHVGDLKESKDTLFYSELESSGVDYFDFYLCHGITDSIAKRIEEEGVFEYLNDKKEEGLLLNLGASFHTSFDSFEFLVNKYRNILDFVQLPINYMDWKGEKIYRQYDLCEKYNIPIIGMSPVKGGLLANGNKSPGSSMISKTANEHKISYVDISYLFPAFFDSVFCVLMGTDSIAETEHNITLFEKSRELLEKDIERIITAGELIHDERLIPCTKCNYCGICPEKVRIPEIMAYLNECIRGELSHERIAFKYNKVLSSSQKCKKCGLCEKVCPQHIKIVAMIATKKSI